MTYRADTEACRHEPRTPELDQTAPVDELPVIDVSPLRHPTGADPRATTARIDAACRDIGFFFVVGHGIPAELRERLDAQARSFFALPAAEKAHIAMTHGGRAWRGWFPLGGELTSGVPDRKEGLYFGQELGPDDPQVRAGVPMHGPNLFPERPAGLRRTVLDYLEAVTELGHLVCRGIALGLGLDERWFDQHLTADPLILFRIFHYPPLDPAPVEGAQAWSVGEHTDYGLITLLGQDASGGLEVRGPRGWIAAPPLPDAFVVNLGDMLERMTGGRYRSTPHRVRNTSGADRLSFPLFFDPAWGADVRPIPVAPGPDDRRPTDREETHRWDGRSVHTWSGTYGDYLLGKVGRVFPELGDEVLPSPDRGAAPST
jgi:isopenicillin N synthase-like dioxygenase